MNRTGSSTCEHSAVCVMMKSSPAHGCVWVISSGPPGIGSALKIWLNSSVTPVPICLRKYLLRPWTKEIKRRLVVSNINVGWFAESKSLGYSNFHGVHFCVSFSRHESYWLPPSCLCLSLKNYPLGFLPACARVELVGVQFSAAFSKLLSHFAMLYKLIFLHVPEETTVWYWMDAEYIFGLKLSLIIQEKIFKRLFNLTFLS